MRTRTIILLIFSVVSSHFSYSQGVWQKESKQWRYDLGANTGMGVLNSGISYETGASGGSTVSTVPSTKGFMPLPPSGSVMLSNKNTDPVGEGEWHLEDHLSSPALKFVSSRAGRVAKFSAYDMGNSTSVVSFFYKITFAKSNSTEMDWQFAVGQTSGGSNPLNNMNSGLPARTSTRDFPAIFANLKWSKSKSDSDIQLTHCYRGVEKNGETSGTTYERAFEGVSFSEGETYNMEIYCNNSSKEQIYARDNNTYTISPNAMHVWANGTQLKTSVGLDIASYQLVPNKKLDAFVFQGSKSVPTKSAVCYIQDIIINQVQNPLK